MKKFRFILLTVLLLLLFSACDGSDRKMKGFTYEELAEYLSSIDGITNIGPGEEKVIYCGDHTIMSSNDLYSYSYLKDQIVYDVFNMKDYFTLLVDVEGPMPEYYNKSLKSELYSDNSPDSYTIKRGLFDQDGPFNEEVTSMIAAIRRYPENFAYIIRDFGFSSFPDWNEWIDYEITFHHCYQLFHGEWNQYWYNPTTRNCEIGHYYRETDNATEIYIIYQKYSLFNVNSPWLMSEEMYEHMKETYADFQSESYRKGTVEEFSKWFMGEYIETIPSIFANIEAEYVYFGTGSIEASADEYDFVSDMEQLGVNFDELRVYIIKATVPHNGTVHDIFWELIG